MHDRERELLRLVLYAYPDRVTLRRANDFSRGVMVGGRGVVLEPSSVVREAPLFLSIDLRDQPGSREARVSIASAIDEEWLAEIHPHLVEQKTIHRYEEEKERVTTFRQLLFAGLLLRESITGPQVDPEGASATLADFLCDHSAEFLARDERASRWLARVRFLSARMAELDLPSFDDQRLRETMRDLSAGCVALEQVRRKPLIQALESLLDWKQRRALEEQAPETIEVPSGSRIKLQYDEQGAAAPILAVRLQEMFGLADTPRIAGGRVAVLLHLLGPNYRPVQVTSDLRSFWNNTYSEVRKDLRARYPKHPWPDDPWNAPPKNVGGRRKS